MRPAAALAGAALLLSGCAGAGFDLGDLPTDDLVIVYRTLEESEDRVQMLEKARDGRTGLDRSESATYDRYDVDFGDALDAFGLGRSAEERAAILLGRLARVDLDKESAEVYDFALGGDRAFDWSPDHTRLLFRSLRHGGVQLYEWTRETGEIRAVTSGPATHQSGSYGPDGRYTYSRHEPKADGTGRNSRIFVTEVGGGLPKALTEGPGDTKPVWSPDGSAILFESVDPAGRAVISSVTPDGSTPRRIARGRDPDFHPDGTWVVFSAQTRQGWRLRLMHPDGTGKRAFGGGAHDEHDPRFSPDGRFVVYVADDEGRQQLRVRSTDGTGDRPVLFHGDGLAPVW